MHIRVDYDEALQSKKDILASEMDLINIKKSLNKYILLREIELKLKAKFYREIKKIVMKIKLLEANLPPVRIPRKRNLEEPKIEAVKGISVNKEGGDLEDQLREIQRKLKALSY